MHAPHEQLAPDNFAGIRQPLERAETLPPWCYTSPEFFALEMHGLKPVRRTTL